jgi:branched-chain amino acid transport system permease protein
MWTFELGLTQVMNGLQLGVLLFLVSAGLTLLLGIMNFINLAHGSMYMVAAYIAAQLYVISGSFVVALSMAVVSTFVLGLLIDIVCLRTMYERGHLDQVLVTFGLTLVFNEGVRMIWGPGALEVPIPNALSQTVDLGLGIVYPAYRLFIIVVGLLVAVVLSLVITRTRVGMIIRAAASQRSMTSAMGINVTLLSTFVFAAGSALAGLSGVIAAPLFSVQSGMGDPILILALVVIVVGGIGSIRGALFGSVLVGLFDTLGRAYFPQLFVSLLKPSIAHAAGPAFASMLIYILMVAVLIFRPQGLLPVRTRKS